MIYNTIEQDSAEPITEYKEKPTWGETLSAATKNFTSVSLSTSASNYYFEERDATVNEWKKQDPANKELYDFIGSVPKQELDKLEALYAEGRYDAVRGFKGSRSRHDAEEGEATKGTAYIKFKEIQEQNGFTDPSEMRERAEQKSYNDYMESGKILAESDHLSAKLLGTMGGALQDPVTIATLPLGSWKTGGSLLMNAARAFGEEALIETGAQALIIPTTYAYKQEIGIKTTLKDEAYNAAVAIGSAGLFRGAGSAAFDLTAKGIKSLKAKDPQLGEEYEALTKSQATESLDEHIDALYKVEFEEGAEIVISNPNEKGIEISKAKPMPIESEDIIKAAQESKDFRTPKKEPIETLNTDRIQKYVGDRKGADHTELDLQLQKIEGDYEGPAIRGMLDTEGALSKLQVGDVYETRGVTSIAKDKDTADLFAKEEFQGKTGEKIYVNFESFTNKPVNIGEGNKIGFDSMLDAPTAKAKGTYIEDEVLIPSGRSFEVVKKEKIGDETHITVKETIAPEQVKPDPIEMKLYSGEDEAGNPIYKSHNELKEEADMDALWIQKAKDCII